MDFYKHKSNELPRFIYRNLAKRLEAPSTDRAAAVEDFYKKISSTTLKGDYLKLKYVLPKYLESRLTEAERQCVSQALFDRRKKRNERLLTVYPHCTDEFALDVDFLTAALGCGASTPLIHKSTPIATIGSCFARNIAVYLKNEGYNIKAFQLAEDLNSPFSNAKMLSICASSTESQRAYLEQWARVLYPKHLETQLAEIIKNEISRLRGLNKFIRESEVIIITCGNIIDYFLPSQTCEIESGPSVAPKFLAISASEDINIRNYITSKLRAIGSDFRLGNYTETVEALKSQYNAIRTINRDASIIFTLSPVPIDSAIGVESVKGRGAVELDCISKSTLRVALEEFLQRADVDQKLFYFPSYEIVRWIAPNVLAPVFGKEDAASRHVSAEILAAVYQYFIHQFGGKTSADHSGRITERATPEI